jgi:AAA+ superfamily predicted ATPase
VLEYYRGVLVLTSNRATIIDDAIVSRATAHLRYELPTKADLSRIWAVLSEQYKIKLNAKAVDVLVEAYPKLSGRNVKNLLKLAKLVADRDKELVTPAHIDRVVKFLDLTTGEKK